MCPPFVGKLGVHDQERYVEILYSDKWFRRRLPQYEILTGDTGDTGDTRQLLQMLVSEE